MAASNSIADPTKVLCSEVLANCSGDSSVSRLEDDAMDAVLGCSASDTLTALSSKAKAASVLALKLAVSSRTLSGADTAAGEAVSVALRRH